MLIEQAVFVLKYGKFNARLDDVSFRLDFLVHYYCIKLILR